MTAQYLDRRQLRCIAATADFHPSPSWGQHFLHDATAARLIIAASGVRSHDHVLDVGAGMGSLTLALLDKGASVTAVEIDPLLAQELPIIVAQHTHSEIHRLTVLNREVSTLRPADLSGPPTAVVLNVPASVAVDAALHLLTEFPSIRSLTAVIDSTEAAQRLTGLPGTPKCSSDGAKLRFFGAVHHRGVVAPTAWWPAQRVHHSLVCLDRYQEPQRHQDLGLRTSVFALIDAAFAQRRNSCRTAFAAWAGSTSESARRLLAASIDPARRADSLGILDFIRLHERSALYGDGHSTTRSNAVA